MYMLILSWTSCLKIFQASFSLLLFQYTDLLNLHKFYWIRHQIFSSWKYIFFFYVSIYYLFLVSSSQVKKYLYAKRLFYTFFMPFWLSYWSLMIYCWWRWVTSFIDDPLNKLILWLTFSLAIAFKLILSSGKEISSLNFFNVCNLSNFFFAWKVKEILISKLNE
jgi:hypothetical protein